MNRISVEQVEEKLERELTPEEADEKAAVVLPADVVSGIGDSNWKTLGPKLSDRSLCTGKLSDIRDSYSNKAKNACVFKIFKHEAVLNASTKFYFLEIVIIALA